MHTVGQQNSGCGNYKKTWSEINNQDRNNKCDQGFN